jgi:hypothetical protein
MSKALPPLARSVLVGSTAYRIGDIPPLKHARKITNPRNWEGGETPDFDNGGYEDTVETVDGIGNSDAANAGRTGLPGFGADGVPKNLVTDTTGDQHALLKRTGGEGAGSGEGGTDDAGEGGDDEDGKGDGDGGDTGTGDTGQGEAATATTPGAGAPTASRARKATKATAASA